MKKNMTQLLFSISAIVLLIAFVAYGQYVVTDITNTFIESRKTETKFFAELVRNNWDGIKNIPDEKKKILLETLDPELAATDIRVMSQIIIILLYLIGAGFILDRLIVIGKVLWAMRYNKSLNPD